MENRSGCDNFAFDSLHLSSDFRRLLEARFVIDRRHRGLRGPSGKDPGLIERLGGDISGSVSIIPAIFTKVPEKVIGILEKCPGVKYVEPDYKARALGFFDWLGGGDKDKQVVPWGIERINARKAAAMVDEGDIDVAIIDTGIDYRHGDLDANVVKGVSTVGWFTLGGKFWAYDWNGHGTHCAGIVAAEMNDIGVVGVGPELDLYAVKALNFLGMGNYSDIIEGIDWAVNHGAEVVSMSLGGSNYSKALKEACDRAYESGVVLVAAAGNSGDGDPSTNEVAYPAKYESVIAVAATNKNDETARWSSEGAEVEVAAPGVDIYSTWKWGGYETHSGTSMACPHVSGTVALILAADPSLTPGEVRSILRETAIDIEALGKDKFSGYGLILADKAVEKGT